MNARQTTLLNYKTFEKARENRKLYYLQNKERIDARHREYYKLNKGKELARVKDWRRLNPESTKEGSHIRYLRRKVQMNQREKDVRALSRTLLFGLLGSQCTKCGYSQDIRALQFDHINGGGRRDVRRWGNHTNMLRYYSVHSEEAKRMLQVLCANCNIIKLYTPSSH